MQLGHIEIFVSNIEKSREFYEKILGLKLIENQDDEFLWFRVGDIEILLRPGGGRPASESYQQAPTGFVFYVGDVQATAEQLRAQGLEIKGTDGSPDCLTFTDPDGNWFQLTNPEHI